MTLITSGIDPGSFIGKKTEDLLRVLNSQALRLEKALVQDTPTGVSSTLRQAWFVRTASKSNPVAEVENSQNYLLPVELGRKPGKGVSLAGQRSVTDWATYKLGLGEAEARSFAFLLSRKYFQEGRPATGFIGLATPGSTPTSNSTGGQLEPLPDTLLSKQYQELRRRLDDT